MKKGKIIGGLCLLIIILIAVCLLFIYQKNDIITIQFNSDGGSRVESIEVEKGGSIKLPNVTKDGYTFVGWYLDSKKVSNDTKYDKDVILKAKWLEESAKTYTITFDSDGGSNVDDLIVECDKELSLPENPTKEGYEFISWIDKNETPILDKALLACENVTLKANWKKIEEKVEEKKEEKKEPVKEIKYSCPNGYKLNGTKCELEDKVLEKCPDGTREYEGNCVTINYSARKEANRKCGSKIINTGGGSTPTVEGELFKMGTYYCYYKEVPDSYEQQNSSNCTSRGHKWNSSNNRCYYDKDEANVNIIYSCDNNYVHISDPNKLEGINGLNGGCFPIKDKVKYCLEGFNLKDNKCLKIIDATIN